MKHVFRALPLATALLAAGLGLSSCSKEQDAVPAAPTAKMSHDVQDPNTISGPSVIGYGQRATYKFFTVGYRSQFSVDESTGFTVISNTQSGNVITLILQAPTYPSTTEIIMDSDYPSPYQGSKLVEAGNYTGF